MPKFDLKKMKIFVKIDNLGNSSKINKIYATEQYSKRDSIIKRALSYYVC